MSDRRAAVSVILVIVVAIAAVSGVWWLRNRGSAGDPTQLDASTGAAVAVLDGWSRTVLGVDPTWGQDGPATETALWRDMTADDAQRLLAASPDVVADLMARMVVAVPRPTCDTDGCRSGDDDLPLSYLTDPASIPVYGPMYEAWGIGPARVAQLGLYPTTQSVSFAVGESTSGPYNVDSGAASPLPVAEGAEAEAEIEAELGADTAPNANVIGLAGSFGALFHLKPAWIPDSEGLPARAYNPTSLLTSLDPTVDLQLERIASSGSAGLAGQTRDLWGLDASALTALSSPTTGCLGVVVCAPRPVDVTVDGGVVGVDSVCETSVAPGSFAGASRLGLVVRDETWTVQLPHPIAQGGAWGGEQPPGPVAGIWGPGPMPLYDGTSPLRIQTASLYAGQGSIWAFAGRITEIGVDADAATWGSAEAVAALGEGRYVKCPVPQPDSTGRVPGVEPLPIPGANGSGGASGGDPNGESGPPDTVGNGAPPPGLAPTIPSIDNRDLGDIPNRVS
jgi:hypothetical protein